VSRSDGVRRGDDGCLQRSASGPTAKFLVVALALLLLVGTGLALAADPSSDVASEAPRAELLSAALIPESAEELPAARTATSRTYELANGSRALEIFQAPVNYRAADGDWKAIQTGLREVPGEAGFTNGPSSFDLRLPDAMGEEAVRLADGEQWVSYKLLGASAPLGELEGSKATYGLAREGVAFELTSTTSGVKEEIELQGPSSQSSFAFELDASEGLAPEVGDDGSVVFADEEGAAFAVLPPPTIADSAGAPEAADNDAVSYSLSKGDDGTWRLVVEADRKWLEDPQRVWPVTIDPTMTLSTLTGYDFSIHSSPLPNGTVYSGSNWSTLGVGYDPNGTDRTRAYTKFDLSSLPAGASVYDATLALYNPYTAENTSGLEVRQLTQNWDTDINWARYKRFSNWTTPGGDFGSVKAEIKTSERPGGSAPGPWNFNSPALSDLVADWVGGQTPNYGVIVKQTEEAGSYRFVHLNSSSATPTETRPKLIVNYWNKAPATSKVVSPSEGTRTAKRLRLQAKWSEAGVTGITWQFREGKSGVFKTIPGELVKDADGKAVSWPVSTSGATSSPALYFDAAHASTALQGKGGSIQVRALFAGSPSVEGVSDPVEALVDRFLGGPKDATAQVGPGTLDLLTGNLSVTRTDVAMPGFGTALEFTRTHNSRAPGAVADAGVLGQGWKPTAPVEEAGGAAWRSVKTATFSETIEGENYSFDYALLTDLEGYEIAFEKVGESYETPPEMTGWKLSTEGSSKFVLTDPDGNRTTFENSAGAPAEYLPVSVTQLGGAGNKTRMDYQFVNDNRRLTTVIAPSPPGVSCTTVSDATTKAGCRGLTFTYKTPAELGLEAWVGDRLSSISYHAPGQGGPWEVARYEYDSSGRLIAAWDPRVSPALKETYAYDSGGRLKTITPAGLEPVTLEYGTLDGEEDGGRLVAVKRPSLVASPSVAQTTIVYGVPLSGGGAPNLSDATVATWGQQDSPVEATAIFRPDEVPSNPPSSYAKATVYYMDPDGFTVNTVTGPGAGTLSNSIATTETDEFGNVVRELTPENRVRALTSGGSEAEKIARSKELDTHRQYSADGTEMQQEWGPLHEVRLASGASVQARLHTVVEYDAGFEGGVTKAPQPHLPTRVTTGASVAGQETDLDQRVTETKYDWTLRKPVETIVDPSGLNIRTVTVYDSETGLPVEQRQPSNTGGGGAGTTKTVYYSADGHAPSDCQSAVWSGLPCKVTPAAQPGTAGQPEIVVKKFTSYNAFAQPTEIREAPGQAALDAGTKLRTTVLTYDAAGRPLTQKITGGGAAVPKTETLYSSSTGMPSTQRFVCEAACEAGTPTYTSAFGSSGSANGQFSHPGDVAVDAAGNLWVADMNNNRIQKFNDKGEFLMQFGSTGSGNGQFKRPAGIAVDPNGNVWVADANNNRIQKFNDKGEYLAKTGSYGSGNGQFKGPEGIAVDANDRVYVADTANGRIQVFNSNPAYLKTISSEGSGPGQLGEPTRVAIGPDGKIWVTDWLYDRVAVFDEAGTFVKQFGSNGTGNGQFKHPDGLEVRGGNVWVTDEWNYRVQLFNEAGEYVTKVGSQGSGAGQFAFRSPTGIVADAKGALWVTDPDNNRVQKWALASSFDDQATTTTYDTLGRPTGYEDADGNKSTVTYDLLGRPATTSDGKGTQTFTYDANRGLLTKLVDSAAGTFTATYDSDGSLVKRVLPNGITAKTTYDQTGAPTQLSYTKTSSCGVSCTWLEFGAERSIDGQILSQTSTLSSQLYTYDNAGRLTVAKDTPKGGSCTTRAYTFDSNSNRTSMTTRSPGLGGICAESGGTTQNYSYDAADRLTGEGIVYDDFGRTTSLPAVYAGGKALTTSYFATDMVASQSQNGVTNTFQLDSSLRQRQRVQGGGFEGTEVFHYAGAGDAPAWTELATKWSRNITGIAGELIAIQDSSAGTRIQLTNLHGDVVATASPSPTATALLSTFEFDEYGNPKQGSTPRFGWVGGAQRRTELASGVIQMGVRSYVPALGRFLSPDPIFGGSANPYEYASADPVNNFDLTGQKCVGNASFVSRCKAMKRREARHRNVARGVREAVVRTRQCKAIACTSGWPSGGHKDSLIKFLTKVATTTVDYLIHGSPTEQGVRQHLRSIYGAATGAVGQRVIGCGLGALAAWNATSLQRAEDPLFGTLVSAGAAGGGCVEGSL